MTETLLRKINEYGYEVVEPVLPDTFGRYHGVVKNKNNKTFFVKAVIGKNNYSYNSLLDEICITQRVSEITNNQEITENGYRLIVPRVDNVINDNDLLCLISEYIEGNKLIEQNSEVKASIIENTIELMRALNKAIQSSVPQDACRGYTNKNLVFKIPVKLLKCMYFKPKMSSKFIKTALKTLPLLFIKSDKSLVHADINCSNIIYKKNDIYLIDWEQAGLGIFEYNVIGPISVHWTDTIIRNALLDMLKTNKRIIEPLLAYRTLELFNQNIVNSDSRRIRDYELINNLTNENSFI